MPEIIHKLFPAQAAFFSDQSPYVAAVTGIGGGKGYVLALKALAYMN